MFYLFLFNSEMVKLFETPNNVKTYKGFTVHNIIFSIYYIGPLMVHTQMFILLFDKNYLYNF